MKAFFKNKWTIVGLMLVVAGWGPFCVVLALRLMGRGPGMHLTALGLLLFATFWPAVVCLILGFVQTWNRLKPRGSNETG